MIQITAIQLIGIIIGIIVFYQSRTLYKEGKFRRTDFQLWAAFSIAVLVISFFPRAIDVSLKYLKISRAIDALIILSVFGAYVLIFQIYIKIQETQREITEVVRKVALKFEEKNNRN